MSRRFAGKDSIRTIQRRRLAANQSTEKASLQATDYLYQLDKVTSEVVRALVAAQAGGAAAGDQVDVSVLAIH